MGKITMLSDVLPVRSLLLSEEDKTNYVYRAKRVTVEKDKRYDFAILLGCGDFDILRSRTEQIGKLFQEGNIDKIIATGGVGHISKERGVTEASVMKGILLEMGISESDILLEDKSKDTIGNMTNSLKLIRKECGQGGKVVLGTSEFHAKRAEGLLIKTAESENIPVEIAMYGTLDGKHDMENWMYTKDSFIKMEAFWLSSYRMLKKIPDMPVENLKGVQRARTIR